MCTFSSHVRWDFEVNLEGDAQGGEVPHLVNQGFS